MSRILVVDDDQEIRLTLRSALSATYSVEEAADGVEAMEKIEQDRVDLVVLDMDMPRMGGMETLAAIKKVDPRIIVLILTAYSTVPDAVAAIRAGAYNYLAKPIRHGEIRSMVERALAAHDMMTQMAYSAPVFQGESGEKLSSHSSEMKKVFSLIEKVAMVDTAVLLRGESGTGKEVVATAIHHNSLRKDHRFVAVNCSAIPENLVESELFGHEKGAFTGAEQRKIGKFQYAQGGTLFLDEVAEISPTMQVKLLRVLQEKKFTPVGSNLELEADVRIIAATNQNLEQMLEKGGLREDFYYRLNVLPIFLPALRDRKEDLEFLVRYFVVKFNAELKKSIQGVDAYALARLKEHHWPGNIRELSNVIEHAFVLEGGSVITELSLPEYLQSFPAERSVSETPTPEEELSEVSDMGALDFQISKEKFEREFIVSALRKFKGKINQTSANTNIPKKTLLRKIEKYKIDTSEFKV